MSIGELDFTMLHQICQRGRLTAFIQDGIASDNQLSKALQVLVPQAGTKARPATMSPLAEAKYNGQGKNLPLEVYDLILTHMNMLLQSSPLRHFKNLPHPMDAYILP